MDKLRSLQYFVAAAEEKSLSGAARRFGVSTQAVAKLMRDLGFRPSEGAQAWVWRGRAPRREAPHRPETGHAFAALAGLKRG